LNFFSHYHFFYKSNNPWYNAGLLFPDLLRNFTTSDRISEKKEIVFSKSNKSQLNLQLGIQDHLKADSLFHNWSWFVNMNKELSLIIRNSDLGIKRDWFLAHIFIELAIDHVLVKENESQVNILYEQLSQCHSEEWSLFFSDNHFLEINEWNIGFNQFINHRYIMTYKNTKNVIYALNRIYQNTGIGKFDDNQTLFLEKLLNTFVPEVKTNISELYKILK
jgi:hypothetical protein